MRRYWKADEDQLQWMLRILGVEFDGGRITEISLDARQGPAAYGQEQTARLSVSFLAWIQSVNKCPFT